MRTPERILREMSAIPAMAKGTLCVMRRTASGKTYYNHQTWSGGRNVVRYVPPEEVQPLRKAIAGYRKFLKLADEYTEAVSNRTEFQRKRRPPCQKPKV